MKYDVKTTRTKVSERLFAARAENEKIMAEFRQNVDALDFAIETRGALALDATHMNRALATWLIGWGDENEPVDKLIASMQRHVAHSLSRLLRSVGGDSGSSSAMRRASQQAELRAQVEVIKLFAQIFMEIGVTTDDNVYQWFLF